jgi:hypothetical protein
MSICIHFKQNNLIKMDKLIIGLIIIFILVVLWFSYSCICRIEKFGSEEAAAKNAFLDEDWLNSKDGKKEVKSMLRRYFISSIENIDLKELEEVILNGEDYESIKGLFISIVKEKSKSQIKNKLKEYLLNRYKNK